MATMLSKTPVAGAPATQFKSSIAGQPLRPAVFSARPQAIRRFAVAAETETKEKSEKKSWSPPTLDPSTPAPIFGGSTGGLLSKAQTEEFYVLTWEAKKEEIFEMPTGGAAIMQKGPNLLKLARKEQCLALLASLRSKFKTDGAIYRVFPNGEVQYLHPKDGVYPEKVNAGRQAVGTNDRSIGKNTNPVKIKFTGKAGTYDV